MSKVIAKQRGIYEKVKGSGIWWVRWTDAAGNKRREKAGAKGNAVKLLAKRHTEKIQQVKLPELTNNDASLLFNELLDDAITHSKAENGERSTHELSLKIERLRPDWGSRKVRDIKKQDVVGWLQAEKEERGWTDATANRWQAAFSLVFRVGMDNEKIKFNPAARIKRKAENNQSVRFLTSQEEKRISTVLKKRSPAFLPTFLVSLHTGLRASEQWRLEWSDINFDQKVLTVRKLANTKNGRHIPLNHIAVDALHTLHKISGPTGPVFLNSKDTPMTAHREWFDPAVAEAKVNDYTWHKNRHTFASRLAMLGESILTISKLLGHATIQMTMRYAHLSPDHHQTAVDRLATFGKQRDTRTDTTRSRLQIVK